MKRGGSKTKFRVLEGSGQAGRTAAGRKKRRLNWSRLLIVVFLAVIVLLVAGMYHRLVELTSQIRYLQDTTNIILSDVGGMESAITQTLKEESGMVEHYSIELADMDFAADTCEVSVYMIPKEYTDNTSISVFFGTQECPLARDGYAYTGAAVLPLGKSFDGNLTFLFSNGKKKSTEVYSNYDGIQTHLEEVLSAGMQGTPEYKDGQFTLDGDVNFSLNGCGQYEFERFELAAFWEEEEIWTQEITEQALDKADNAGNAGNAVFPLPDSRGEAATEAAGLDTASEHPISVMAGSMDFTFSCEPEQAGTFRLCLRALSAEGYRFECGLLLTELVEEDPQSGEDGEGGEDRAEDEPGREPEQRPEPEFKLDEDSIDRSVSYIVYDKKGGKRVIH